VTPFIRRDPRFVALQIPAPLAVRRPDLRFTIDTAQDLAFVRALFEMVESTSARPVSLAALIKAAGQLTIDV
jgi:spore coat polysaccharide biosynthesis protein SpsF (cytidylyltransferase family)